MLKRLAIAACPALPSLRAAIVAGQWRELPPKARVVGWSAAARLWFARWCEAGQPSTRFAKLRLAGFRYPLFFRPGGSDAAVIHQVFVEREYAAVADLPSVEFIVDCGANIGCTTFYLLHRYPHAKAIVIEPDAGNMAVCRRNLSPFRERVMFVQAGVWSSSGPLVVERGTFRDGTEWSFRVRPAAPHESPDIHAVTIPDVLRMSNFPRIDLLKVDIEGAEIEMFRTAEWLRHVRNIAIETHGPECERAVADALCGYRWEAGTSGELAIYRNLTIAGAS